MPFAEGKPGREHIDNRRDVIWQPHRCPGRCKELRMGRPEERDAVLGGVDVVLDAQTGLAGHDVTGKQVPESLVVHAYAGIGSSELLGPEFAVVRDDCVSD